MNEQEPTAEKDAPDPIVVLLKAERQRQGLTQTEVARAIGRKTYQTVHQWEKGINPPSIVNVRAWANALGYDLVLTNVTPPDVPRDRAPRNYVEQRVLLDDSLRDIPPGAGDGDD